jgi:predicted MPP superfamily phosphohydrolase
MDIAFNHILIIIFLLNFYACLEGYFLLRAVMQVRSRPGGKIPVLIYWVLSLLAAALYFYFRISAGNLRSAFSVASSYWGFLPFIPFFILADVLTLGAFFYRRRDPERRFRPARSGALFNVVVRIAAIVLAFGTLALGSLSARYAKVTSYSINIEKPLPQNGLKVVFISDIHIGSMVHKKQLARIVSKINTLEADIVLLAGDIIDRNMNAYISENLNEEMGAIKARLGVYAAPGNHDYFGGDLGELETQLAAAGIKLLNDEVVLVEGIYIAGRNDFSSSRRGVARKPLSELTGNLDAALPLIVMDHQPREFGEAEAAGVDLQVSGHTHRGQMWPVSLIVKRMYENSYGLSFKDKTAFVVSSGSGTWGPPVRIGTRSEIVCVDLKNPMYKR